MRLAQLLAICVFVLGLCGFTTLSDRLMSVQPAATGYTAQGVHFNGSTTLFNPSALNAPLTGAADSKVGTMSVWINMGTSTDGTTMGMFSAHIVNSPAFVRLNSNILQFVEQDSTSTNNLVQRSVATITVSSGWTHIAASWNLATPVFQLYINGSVASVTNLGLTNSLIAYSTNNKGVQIGSSDSGENYTGDLADLFVDEANFLDLSVSANLQKFINGGNAVDFGTNCATPTGSQPIICLRGAVGTWPNNVGSGGAFTVHTGSLTAAATNPP